MKKQGSTHSPEHVHIFTFHFFCLSRENLEFENGRKTRLGFGGGEILPHLRELDQVPYMVRIVSSCWTFVVLWVFVKKPGIESWTLKNRARAFSNIVLEVEDSGIGLGLLCVFFIHTPFFGLHPLSPFALFLLIFDIFFFHLTHLFFLSTLKFWKYFSHHFLIFIWFFFDFSFDLYMNRYIFI